MTDSGIPPRPPPGPSREAKGKAKVGEPTTVTSDDDQSDRISTEPAPSLQKEERSEPNSGYSDCLGDDENCYLSRTLSASEVDGGPLDTILLLDGIEAYGLTGLDAFLEDDVIVNYKTLRVYDERRMGYDLQLSPFIANKAFVGYSISGQWAELVADNKLEVGDRILFMHPIKKNENASDLFNYEIKFIRKKPKLSKAEVKLYKRNSENEICPDLIMRPGPSSRFLSKERWCFSKTLAALEVVHDYGKPRLFLNDQDAKSLLECPDVDNNYRVGKLRENLVVFDAGNRQYDMLLSNISTGGKVMYVVDAGWQRFTKIHTLTAGDAIFFYRIMDNNVHDKLYYALRYIKHDIPSCMEVSGAGPSGSRTRSSGSGAGPSDSAGSDPSGSRAGPSVIEVAPCAAKKAIYRRADFRAGFWRNLNGRTKNPKVRVRPISTSKGWRHTTNYLKMAHAVRELSDCLSSSLTL